MAVRLNSQVIDCFQFRFGCKSIVVNEGKQIEFRSPVWEAQPGTLPVPEALCGVPLVFSGSILASLGFFKPGEGS